MRYREMKKLKIGDRVTYKEVSGTPAAGTVDSYWQVNDYALFKADDLVILSDDEVETFKRDSVPFTYQDSLGVVRGFRHRDGTLLVTDADQ